jgi:hypothetical protein
MTELLQFTRVLLSNVRDEKKASMRANTHSAGKSWMKTEKLKSVLKFLSVMLIVVGGAERDMGGDCRGVC